MTEIVKAVRTCISCPSQWDAWDTDGNYWYLRYRHGRGTAEKQPSPNLDTWSWKTPELVFDGAAAGMGDGYISLGDFCRLSGLEVSAGLITEERMT